MRVAAATRVKNGLQAAGVVTKVIQRGTHRTRRERAPMAGVMLHRDRSTHEWVAGRVGDLIVTIDDLQQAKKEGLLRRGALL